VVKNRVLMSVCPCVVVGPVIMSAASNETCVSVCVCDVVGPMILSAASDETCVSVCVCDVVAPVIMSAASDETVIEGQSVSLRCQTSAVPPVAVVWRHDTQPVHDDDRIHMTGIHSTLHSLLSSFHCSLLLAE